MSSLIGSTMRFDARILHDFDLKVVPLLYSLKASVSDINPLDEHYEELKNQIETPFLRDGESERIKVLNNRMMLWRCSRRTDRTGILAQGLQVAPFDAPSTGYLLSKGACFSDVVSKSADYCCTSPSAFSSVKWLSVKLKTVSLPVLLEPSGKLAVAEANLCLFKLLLCSKSVSTFFYMYCLLASMPT
ncbi:Poly [ADP-ribose] polymerase [Echinococcus granulosus]|uniref:Poly [ADP-ribose] polymerase n=1 Tax=Echinococcus granulosus TaxID=6210 RepID=W6UK34_ECHGR|nr:Poly [ADP-ribose] polymerase [Echinococcus granulosus]EUB53869.1 Poly [ADP-ribose] polymerase [Echinococcus granulosus]